MIRVPAVISVVSIIILSLSACSKEEPVTQESAAEGAKLFSQNCRTCHGQSGKGDICPDLTDNVWKYGNSDKELFESISMGRPGGMPAWSNSLSEKQIRELIGHVKKISEN